MTTEPRRRHVTASVVSADLAAAAAVTLGVAALVGWATGVEVLKSFLTPARIAMNPVTAACFVLGGCALWLARESRRTPRRDLARVVLAAAVVAVAGIKLVDLLPSINTTVDELLFRSRLGANRMAPNTALGFALTGLSLLLLEKGHVGPFRPSTVLALLSVALSMLALTGYLYEVKALYRMAEYIGMALNTGLGLLLLSVGVLCARPHRQPLAVLVSETAGGVVARRLVPVAVAVPLLLGWLAVGAIRRFLPPDSPTGERDVAAMAAETGVMLFALAIVVVFLSLVWWIARSLYRLDLERADAERQVEDNYHLMRTLIDNLPDRIFAKDRDSRFLVNNEAHLNILGAAGPADAIGKTDEDFFPPDVARPFIEEERRIVATGEGIVDQEQRRRSRAGEERWVTITKVPFRNAQGEIAGIVGIAHDVTALKHAQSLLREQNEMLERSMESEREAHERLKRAQSQLVQSEKLASLGQMVAGVAHEINNPLSFVANNVAVLQRDLRAMATLLELYAKADRTVADRHPELAGEIRALAERVDLAYTIPNIQDLLTRSREGLRRIQQIVKDLRDFARLDEADLHDVDLNEGIRSTANIILGVAKKKRVAIDLDLGPLPTVTCYPAKVNQVVMNLLANAIQASHEGGKVTVRTRDDGDGHVAIQVIDAGTGIPARVRDRIFDPFFTTKPPGEGTGLGLSISYGIVQDHGGRIDVQSEEGKGTTFTVTLPVKRPGRAADAAMSSRRSPGDQTSGSVDSSPPADPEVPRRQASPG
jgi:PAS domain S-box-containing protein